MKNNQKILQKRLKIIFFPSNISRQNSEIECDWNDEVLIINEDIRHIQKDHVIIFLEIVDILTTNRNFEPNGTENENCLIRAES